MERVLEQWDRAAERYRQDQSTSADAAWNRLQVERRFPRLHGESVLDVGCGFGSYTDYFRRAGAVAVGCDGSPAMLELARQLYPTCTFDLADLLKPLPYEDRRFDLLFCNQVLMDLAEIDGLFRQMARVLRPGGMLYVSIVHPASYPGRWMEADGAKTGKLIRDYGRTYHLEHAFCGETTHFHRPVSSYLNLAAETGFRLTRMEEPCLPDGSDAGMPLFLFLEFRRQKGE